MQRKFKNLVNENFSADIQIFIDDEEIFIIQTNAAVRDRHAKRAFVERAMHKITVAKRERIIAEHAILNALR